MWRFLATCLAAGLLGAPAAPAQEPTEEPLELGTSEKATVRLVLLDVVVVDRDGRTVPDLTADDFEIIARGDLIPVDTLDVDCPGGTLDEPRSVARPSKRTPPEGAGGGKIVLAFDYLHLGPLHREDALEQAKALVRGEGLGGDEVMVAALTGGLRVEQIFTADREDVLRSLRRMQYDISLWNGTFSHINEHGFVNGLTALFDVLGTVPGPKAVVLYSAMGDVPLDLQFQEMAAIASASRCSVYPVDTRGLVATDLNFGAASANLTAAPPG